MNVYLYQNNTEKILKNAYIGEVYYYNYIFKWKTTTQIQNDFSVLRGTLSTNSDWFCWTSSSDCWLTKSIPSLSNAKKIIIKGTVVVNSINVSNNAAFFWISTNSGTSMTSYAINWVEWSTYWWCKVTLRTNNATTNGNAVWNAVQGTYTTTFTIDFENKTLTGSVSWFSNSTLTLTDSQITELKWCDHLTPYVSVNCSAISDISIEIDY